MRLLLALAAALLPLVCGAQVRPLDLPTARGLFAPIVKAPSLAAAPVPGAYTRYVNGATGSDSNDGTTAAKAWRTLEYAGANVPDGGVVGVAPGIYSPVSVTPQGTFQAFAMNREFAARTWFVNTNRAAGPVRLVGAYTDGRALYVNGAWSARNYAFSGFRIEGAGLSGSLVATQGAICVSGGSAHDVDLVDCEIVGASAPGVPSPLFYVRTEVGGANAATGGQGVYAWRFWRCRWSDGANPSVPFHLFSSSPSTATGNVSDLVFSGGSMSFALGWGETWGDRWTFDGVSLSSVSGRAILVGTDDVTPTTGPYVRAWNWAVQNCTVVSQTDHGGLFGGGSRYCTISDSSVSGGIYGWVMKEGADNAMLRCSVSSKVDGANYAALYFKAAQRCTASGCAIENPVGSCVKVAAGDTGNKPLGCSLLDSLVAARGTANVFNVAGSAGDAGGTVFNRNRYVRYGSASGFGTLRGATIRSRGDLLAAWASANPDAQAGNDALSTLLLGG